MLFLSTMNSYIDSVCGNNRYHSLKSVSSHALHAQLVDQQVNVESSASVSMEDKVVKKKKKSAGAEALEVNV